MLVTSMGISLPFIALWPPMVNPLLWVGLALTMASAIGEWLGKKSDIPKVLIYTLFGLIAGHFGLLGASDQALTYWRIFIDGAFGLLLFKLGGTLNLRWLLNNKWLALTCLLEAFLTAVLVFFVLYFLGIEKKTAAFIASLVISTSPATSISLIMERQGCGQVSERVLLMSFINSGLAIILARLCLGIGHESTDKTSLAIQWDLIYSVSASLALGYFVGKVFSILNRLSSTRGHDLVLLLGMTLIIMCSAQTLHLPSLFSFVMAGLLSTHTLQANTYQTSTSNTDVLRLVQIVFFILLGATTQWNGITAKSVVLLGVAIVIIRLISKVGATTLLARSSGLTVRQGIALGLALMPMSEIPLLLMNDAKPLFPELVDDGRLALLFAIAVLELLGPVIAFFGLRSAGEISVQPQTSSLLPPENIRGA